MLRVPLLAEHREVELVAPLALEELVLHQAGFEAHAEPLGEPRRRLVPLVEPGNDAVQPEFLEAQPEHRLRRLGRIPPPGKVGIEDITDLAARVSVAMPEQDDITGQVTGLDHLDAERQRLPDLGEFGARPALREPLRDLSLAHRLEWHVAAHIRAAAVVAQRIGVIGRQWPQEQPLAAYWVHGPQRWQSLGPHADHPATVLSARIVSSVIVVAATGNWRSTDGVPRRTAAVRTAWRRRGHRVPRSDGRRPGGHLDRRARPADRGRCPGPGRARGC